MRIIWTSINSYDLRELLVKRANYFFVEGDVHNKDDNNKFLAENQDLGLPDPIY